MIGGAVNDRLEAVVAVQIGGSAGNRFVEAVIDTGFTGHLSLRSDVIQSLGLRPSGALQGKLADGTETEFTLFVATVVWHGEKLRIAVLQSSGGNLLGMALLEGSRLTIDAVDAGAVTISPLAEA